MYQGLKSVAHRNESPRNKLKACSLGPRLQTVGSPMGPALQPTGVETPVSEEKENREKSSLTTAGVSNRSRYLSQDGYDYGPAHL